MCVWQVPDEGDVRKMMTGKATKLESQFRLTYSMILNLLRVEDLKVPSALPRPALPCPALLRPALPCPAPPRPAPPCPALPLCVPSCAAFYAMQGCAVPTSVHFGPTSLLRPCSAQPPGKPSCIVACNLTTNSIILKAVMSTLLLNCSIGSVTPPSLEPLSL